MNITAILQEELFFQLTTREGSSEENWVNRSLKGVLKLGPMSDQRDLRFPYWGGFKGMENLLRNPGSLV